MDGSSSKVIVLECVLKHFKKGFTGDYGTKMSPGKLRTLCESEWPTFGVNLPSEGTLDLSMIRAIHQIIIGNPGYPDQFPYIDSWLQVAQTMPSWIQFCANKKGQSKVFVAQAIKPKDQNLTKPVLQGDPEDELLVPLLYIPSIPPPSEHPVPPFPDSPPPSVSPSPPHQQPPSPSNVPHLSPALSLSPQPLSHHLRSSQALAPQARAFQIPLREMQGPQQVDTDGKVQPRCSTDLLNWRNHTLSYSEKPQAMVNLLESIFQTHQPTWDDCQQILLTFSNTEEWH
jgi:hypothetical protein